MLTVWQKRFTQIIQVEGGIRSDEPAAGAEYVACVVDREVLA